MDGRAGLMELRAEGLRSLGTGMCQGAAPLPLLAY